MISASLNKGRAVGAERLRDQAANFSIHEMPSMLELEIMWIGSRALSLFCKASENARNKAEAGVNG